MYSKKLIGTIGTSAFLLEKIEDTFTYDEVSKHNINSNIWVTYKENVYDITKFIDNHPGGKDKSMLATVKG